MDTPSPETGQSAEPAATPTGGAITRRRLLAGSLATGVIAAGTLGIARAQDDPATPTGTTDSTDATPDAATGGSASTPATDTTLSDEALARADEVIAAVQTDRDAAAASVDVADVDAILAQAGIHRDLGAEAAAAGTTAEAVRQAMVAAATARSARVLLEARLSYPGLPSQEVRSSRLLAATFEEITGVSADVAGTTDANVQFFVTMAQDLYAQAYDLYGSGAYAQASRTAVAAGSLAGTVSLLTSDLSAAGDGGLRGGRDRQGGMMRRGGLAAGGRPGGLGEDRLGRDGEATPTGDDSGPVEVPAPEF